MKKLLSVITGLLAGSLLYAMPVLNPGAPALLTDSTFKCDDNACWGIKFGYRGDFVYNKHMRGEWHHVDRFSLYANEGTLALNLWDRLDIYGFVGAANVSVNTSAVDGFDSTTIDAFTAKYNTRTIGGVGIKAILWESCWGRFGTTYIGIDAQYEWMGPAQISRTTIDGTSVAPNNSSRKYKEGQVALGISHRICDLVPYVAATWSKARANFGGSPIGTRVPGALGETVNLSNYENQRQWGFVVGATLVDMGRMSVTAEGRFINETALSVAADIRF
ncbi:MAG: hypothetical protein P4L16_00430 [Chlamydiales bacterium]|nr:hypothetical protein [Chlamydiales bacterium]